MTAPAKLSQIISAIEMSDDVGRNYFDKNTGKVIFVGNDEDVETDAEGPDHDEALLDLPGQSDFDEYHVMERFCLCVEDEEICSQLCHAIKGKGAFGRFKKEIRQFGVADQWFAYRDDALREFAVGWCEANNVAYTDDRPSRLSPYDAEGMSKHDLYRSLAARLKDLFHGERDIVCNAANFAALVYHALPTLNWAGFYLLKGDDLVLGPFQGKPACTRIAVGAGVCGKAAQQRTAVVVDDVHRFPQYISCDEATRSEMVVPIIREGELIGVFDLDSPVPGRFDEEDRAGVEAMIEEFVALTENVIGNHNKRQP